MMVFNLEKTVPLQLLFEFLYPDCGTLWPVRGVMSWRPKQLPYRIPKTSLQQLVVSKKKTSTNHPITTAKQDWASLAQVNFMQSLEGTFSEMKKSDW